MNIQSLLIILTLLLQVLERKQNACSSTSKKICLRIAKNFLNDLCAVNGGEYLNEPMNQSLAYNQIKNYEDISKKRFSNIDKTVYASGYRSFFDITPDLRFILGKDSKITNLFHNLGSGQAMKYSPVLGEVVAEEIMGEKKVSKMFDYSKFNMIDLVKIICKNSGIWSMEEKTHFIDKEKIRFSFHHLLLMRS